MSVLWEAEISSELATDTDTVDDILSRQLETGHSWIVILKHEPASTLKVWNLLSNTMTEIPTTSLVSHLRTELREREHESGIKNSRHPALTRHSSHHAADNERDRGKSNVQVLLAQHKSKKSNKFHIVNAAQDHWERLLDELHSAPILAIETRDDVLESIRETRLSDGDSWRKVIHGVPVSERQYLGQVHELLGDMKRKWREGGGQRVAGLFNFRSGACIYYDLGV